MPAYLPTSNGRQIGMPQTYAQIAEPQIDSTHTYEAFVLWCLMGYSRPYTGNRAVVRFQKDSRSKAVLPTVARIFARRSINRRRIRPSILPYAPRERSPGAWSCAG